MTFSWIALSYFGNVYFFIVKMFSVHMTIDKKFLCLNGNPHLLIVIMVKILFGGAVEKKSCTDSVALFDRKSSGVASSTWGVEPSVNNNW